jgi:hypothetical protein
MIRGKLNAAIQLYGKSTYCEHVTRFEDENRSMIERLMVRKSRPFMHKTLKTAWQAAPTFLSHFLSLAERSLPSLLAYQQLAFPISNSICMIKSSNSGTSSEMNNQASNWRTCPNLTVFGVNDCPLSNIQCPTRDLHRYPASCCEITAFPQPISNSTLIIHLMMDGNVASTLLLGESFMTA